MPKQENSILVVDDLLDWCDTIGGLLKDAGYKVQAATSRAAAIALLESKGFDLAVLDVRLDETDEDNVEGLELAEEIKQRWPAVKIVIITGYETPDIVRKAMEPDAEGQKLVLNFIPKTEMGKLVWIAREALAR